MLRAFRPVYTSRVAHSRLLVHRVASRRLLATAPPAKKDTEPTEIPVPPQTTPLKKSWLTQQVEANPTARRVFFKIAKALGYGSPKQLAGRRTFVLYDGLCARAPDIDTAFWQKECDLPPTFQSWFTVTNLHVWLLTTRLRALPAEHGQHYIQFLLDHFFIDIEDRIRAVLQPPKNGPPAEPYTFMSSFYVNPNAPSTTLDGKRLYRGGYPERLVTRQMKIFREQWLGMSQSLDLALVQGDMEMAAAVWRNLLGARGAKGIALPDASGIQPKFRRSVNLVGSEIEKLEKLNLEEEETKDDGSGVHDYAPEESDKYLAYPELMHDTVNYIRRELVRLENIPDERFMDGPLDGLDFKKVRVR